MSDMGSLVGLLRGLAPCKVLVNVEWVNIFDTAADAIAALVAERDSYKRDAEQYGYALASIVAGSWRGDVQDFARAALQSDSKP